MMGKRKNERAHLRPGQEEPDEEEPMEQPNEVRVGRFPFSNDRELLWHSEAATLSG
jgi:hypothetical protein